MNSDWDQARSCLQAAEALIITAGAGMGVDSGLPDFRGPEGFWRAYPKARHLGLRFEELANPRWFRDDPALAWGFYGHRLQAYRQHAPHSGYERLRERARGLPHGVITSNVDGHFAAAGFSEDFIEEIHGSIHHLQCSQPCSAAIWPTLDDFEPQIDPDSLRAEDWPRCPRCGATARPNILMFGDGAWNHQRSAAQEQRVDAAVRKMVGLRVVIIECGAGTALPTIRRLSESLMQAHSWPLIRINPREAETAAPGFGFACGAAEALERLLA
jgi:NAD-dependent SIR2 family protein deacetylase